MDETRSRSAVMVGAGMAGKSMCDGRRTAPTRVMDLSRTSSVGGSSVIG